MVKVLVEDALNVGANVHLSQKVSFGRGMDTVGEENVDKNVVGVDPEHGASESCMAERVLRGLGTSLPLGGGVEELFIETKRTTVAGRGEMALGEEFDGGLLEVAPTTILSAVEEHLHEFGHLSCR